VESKSLGAVCGPVSRRSAPSCIAVSSRWIVIANTNLVGSRIFSMMAHAFDSVA
jgi:hypothetical protein